MAHTSGVSRRRFLNSVVSATTAVITAAIVVPIAGAFLDPALRRTKAAGRWVKLGPRSLVSGTPTLFNITAEKVDGFMKQQVRASVYAIELDGQPVAMSNICTHLGCPVAWNGEQDKFLCPCHGGVYDKTGKNIAGPPPRPLPRFATRVEGGDLYIEVT